VNTVSLYPLVAHLELGASGGRRPSRSLLPFALTLRLLRFTRLPPLALSACLSHNIYIVHGLSHAFCVMVWIPVRYTAVPVPFCARQCGRSFALAYTFHELDRKCGRALDFLAQLFARASDRGRRHVVARPTSGCAYTSMHSENQTITVSARLPAQRRHSGEEYVRYV
jgi:hypothetical protein